MEPKLKERIQPAGKSAHMLTTPPSDYLSMAVGLRGYHKYRMICTSALHEVLPAKHEDSNSYGPYNNYML